MNAKTAPVSANAQIFVSSARMLAALNPTEPIYCLYGPGFLRALDRFTAGFPGDILYAVKANPAPGVLTHLYAAGVRRFDTASLPEIALVRTLLPDAQCYYMAPVRPIGAAEVAYRQYGLRHFALDCAEELDTLARIADAPQETTLYIRLKAPLGAALFELSSKFGASPEAAILLLRRARDLGFRLGLTFHVGSQCRDPQAYTEALHLAGIVIASAQVPIAALDLGGGFPAPYPGTDAAPIAAHLAAIRQALATLALPPGVALFAEPGRALAAESMSLVAQVVLRHDDKLYLNDGIYGSFAELKLAHGAIRLPYRTLRIMNGAQEAQTLAGPTRPFTLYGPTCDSYDAFPGSTELPEAIGAGDYIEFGMMGAYSVAMRTAFNGFFPDRFVEIAAPGTPPLD